MNKVQIKSILSTYTLESLRVLAKSINVKSWGIHKDELIDSLATDLLVLEMQKDIAELSPSVINTMCAEGTTEISLVNIIKKADIEEKIATNEDFDKVHSELNDKRYMEVQKTMITLNFENIGDIVQLVKAELYSATTNDSKLPQEERKYKWETLPRVILKDVMESLFLEDRYIDVAYVLTYDVPASIDDMRVECQYSETQILNKYDYEQNALREFRINNKLASQKPSDKQINAFVKSIDALKNITAPIVVEDLDENCDIIEKKVAPKIPANIIEQINLAIQESTKLKVNFNKSALDVKLRIEANYNVLGNCPPSFNQSNFISAMMKLGCPKATIKTYAEAKQYIANNSSSYNRKKLVRDLTKEGINGINEKTLENMSDDRIYDYSKKLKNVAGFVGSAFAYSGINIWELLDKLSTIQPSQLLSIQKACISKDEQAIIVNLKNFK